MIGMQMCAEHDVDVLGRDAGGVQARQIGCVELMEAGEAGTLLVIAGTAVDQDGVPRRSHQPRMHRRD
jgi:hypothetical protein